MGRRLIAAAILTIYTAAVLRLFVFKFELVRIGPLRFRSVPTTGEGNLVPLRSIAGYLQGEPSASIALANLLINVALFVPIGLLLPIAIRTRWPVVVLLALALGLGIETAQAVLQVGIFDVDDVLLNALGVLLGYGAAARLASTRLPSS